MVLSHINLVCSITHTTKHAMAGHVFMICKHQFLFVLFFYKLDHKLTEKLLSIFVVVPDCFYIVLFSALEQTHCALVACDSYWVTVASYSTFFLISIETVYLGTVLFGCYMVSTDSLVHVQCTPYNQLIVSLHAIHIYRVHVWLDVSRGLLLWCIF